MFALYTPRSLIPWALSQIQQRGAILRYIYILPLYYQNRINPAFVAIKFKGTLFSILTQSDSAIFQYIRVFLSDYIYYFSAPK